MLELCVFYCQSNTLINTAILTNEPVSLPVIVLAISHDEKVSDVTSAVMCHSTNENTVKVCFGLISCKRCNIAKKNH